jgi:hypothetical protein
MSELRPIDPFSPDVESSQPAPTALLGIVKEAGGNLAETARRLRLSRDTVVSRLRRHGLLGEARRVRAASKDMKIEQARGILDVLPPSDRVRVLLVTGDARERLLDELAAREDLDKDARERLRRARRVSSESRVA